LAGIGLSLQAQPQPRLTPPAYATLPASCNIGDMVTKTGSSAGLYVCTAANTWTIMSGGGGGGGTANVTCTGTADQTAINAAITGLPSGGGSVVIAAGTCGLTASITIAKSNVTLQGQGPSTVLQIAAGTLGFPNVVTLGNGTDTFSNITLRDLTVDGHDNISDDMILIKNHVLQYGIVNVIGLGSGGNDIQNDVGTGINSYGSIRNCNFTNTVDGYSINGAGGGDVIEGNTLTINSSQIKIGGGGTEQAVIIRGNTFVAVGDMGPDGYAIDSSKMLVVSGNSFVDTIDGGIHPRIGPSTVSGNTFYITSSPSTVPMIDMSSAPYSSITGNAIEVYTGNASPVTGLSLNANSAAVSNTMKFWTTQNHIGITAASKSEFTVTGNHLVNTGSGTTKGIIVTSATDFALAGNSVIGFTTGIDMSSSTDGAVASNNVWNNGTGVKFDNSQHATISSNAFEQSSGACVSSNPGAGSTTYSTLVGNSFYTCSNVLNSMTNATIMNEGAAVLTDVTATSMSGAANSPVCVDSAGKLVKGTNTGGVLSCP